ncbi:MAG TPA: hypothetical protein VHU80_10960 [Polyangiaceae bacterium]|jgi:hypothetical protein|nr:hypothetical protein [Polyangiaceae bacterium]
MRPGDALTMMNRAVFAATVAAMTLVVAESRSAPAEPSASPPSVLEGITAIDRPAASFLPKYQPELFTGVGYSGTFSSAARQWPTFVLTPLEGLLFRPGRFDIGAYSELRLGRPDESFGRFEVGVGLEVMWRFIETSLSDWAAVLRNTYVIDTSDPNSALFRPSVGVEVSLVRSLALQVTYDQLYSPSRDFSNGHGLLHGLSVNIKLALCPIGDFCHQTPQPPAEKLDRSPVTCEKAALTCKAARASAAGAGPALCQAAARAMDTSHHPADWDDPVGAFLRAVRAEASPSLLGAIGPTFTELEAAHAASVQGLRDYSALQRMLASSQMLSKSYGYLVTPVMVRDWLGCDASGNPLSCPGDDVCASDTGVAP